MMAPRAVHGPLCLVIYSGRAATAVGKLTSHSLRESDMTCVSLDIRYSSQMQHGEVLVVVIEMRLFEKITPSLKEEGNLHQKIQKPRGPSPKRSHKSELQTLDC